MRSFALCTLIVFAALFAARADAQSSAVSPQTDALQTDLPTTFLPEGVEWDAAHARFLVSSIRQQGIASVDPKTGHGRAFAPSQASVLGMHIDAHRTLWATWTRFGHAARQNKSGLSAWSIDGRCIGEWPLPDADPRVNLGDLAILPDGTLAASDSGTGAIWRFDPRTHRYAQIVAAGKLKSPQGLLTGDRDGTIVLADYSTGLWRITLDSGQLQALASPDGVELRGIDGLYRSGDRLIAVQNGTRTPRILAIELGSGDTVVAVRKWLELKPGDEIGLGTLTADAFWFVANGQWDSYDDDLHPKADAKLEAPRLRRLPLSTLPR
ncbi:MAG TPA: hypothetical protein VF132_13875 [Rudaea sp.]